MFYQSRSKKTIHDHVIVDLETSSSSVTVFLFLRIDHIRVEKMALRVIERKSWDQFLPNIPKKFSFKRLPLLDGF